jgi:Glycosyltransferase
MKIIQLLPSIAYGDAVGNNAIAYKQLLKKLGFKTNIFAENIDSRLPSGSCDYITNMPKIENDDILIYHLAIGSDLNYKVVDYKCKKIIMYHNITPPQFFKGYNKTAYRLCIEGLKATEFLSDKVDYCIADSQFNKENLLDMNYKCKIDVLPILIPFDDYKKKPSNEILKKFNNKTNIVFMGRIVPNKRQEDIIEAFYYYKKYINVNARLILVGSYSGTEKYYEQLKKYVEKLNLDDVYFTGHIKFNEILAYYKTADIFLCMSEHEGFCVPLVEAMFFDVPIIAYDSSAIAGTLGRSGLLIKEKKPIEIAELMNRLIIDKDLREKVIYNQKIRLKDFSYDVIKRQFVKYIEDFIGENYD